MILIEVSQSQKEEYNRFIAAQESGSFLQSWEWGEWQKNLGREAYRFFLTDNNNNNNNIGAIQLIRMPLVSGKYYLYAPYGPVFADGEKIQDSDSKIQTILENLISKSPRCFFIRIEPERLALSAKHLALVKSANIQPAKTLIIDLAQTEDELLSQMHHKTRYNIRLAQKHGVIVQDEFGTSIGNGLFAKEAVELIVNTSKRQGYKGYGEDYYYRMVNFLGIQNRGDLKLHIYKAIRKNKLLASAIMFDFGKTRTFLFGGSSEENKNLMAPYLLHFKAILDAKAFGLSQYNFWGVETSSGKAPGFVRFKLGFAPQLRSGSSSGIKEYAGAYDLIISSFGYKLYRILRRIKKIF